jgi:hypothetical protein
VEESKDGLLGECFVLIMMIENKLMMIPRWKTWRRILLAAGICLAAAYGVYVVHWFNSEDEAVAEANRLDPGWRLEELERKREVFPNEENSALVVLAAAKLWPVRLGTEPDDFWADEGIEQSIVDLPPEMQLNARQEADLKKELDKDAPALREARKLRYLSRGRFPPSGSREDGTAAKEQQVARRIATLLQLHSILQAHHKEADDALNSALGIINAGRSIGDEAYAISQLIRMGCTRLAIHNMERVLAQGEATKAILLSAQQIIENEAGQPLLLLALRGDRADTFQKMSNTKVPFVQPINLRGLFRLQTKYVEAAKAPPEEQLTRVEQLKTEISRLDPLSGLSFSSYEKMVRAFWGNQASLRCAFVAIAVERYRLAHNQWPDSLTVLVPEFLRELPLDPYNGSPLKYRRLSNGVVIYSVGLDGKDNGGKLNRQNPTAEGTEIGFQLWNVKHRREPWRPVVKKEEPAEKN